MINRVKLRLDMSYSDTTHDALLNELLKGAQDAILLYIEATEFPSMLETTAVMLAIDAYNRLGTEGMAAETKGSLSQTYYVNLLEPYQSILDKYLKQLKKKSQVMFV